VRDCVEFYINVGCFTKGVDAGLAFCFLGGSDSVEKAMSEVVSQSRDRGKRRVVLQCCGMGESLDG
jgi:hypothetical protein